MKVIDLLNKIANNDLDTPDYIEFFDRETSKSNKMRVCEENIIYYMDRKTLFLNDEVEIIETKENKIPEKLNTWYGIEPINLDSPTTFKGNSKYIDFNTEMFFDKINEILDYLEEIK